MVGADVARALEAIVANAWHAHIARSTAILSLAGVLLGVSATFSSLHSALNVICPTPMVSTRESIVTILRMRLMSFGLMIGAGLLVVALLVRDALVESARSLGAGRRQSVHRAVGAYTARDLARHADVCVHRALLKFLPTTRMLWCDALLGATAAAVSFEAGKRLFSLYLQHAGTGRTCSARWDRSRSF